MRMFISSALLLASMASAAVLFDGDFGYYASDTAMDSWSWANQAGIYQSYIYGSGYKISTYVDLSSSYCNSAFNPNCKKGALFMIDGTSRWNGQTMLRTEVIPQTQPAASGRRIYRFSMKNIDLNSAYEHQLVFFESHFVEIKYGQPLSAATGDVSDMFQFWVQGQMYWAVPSMGAWHNFAFDVDYSAQTVQLWWSLGGNALVKVGKVRTLSGVSFSDFHVGILRLTLNNQQDSSATHIQYSNVFIEDSLSDLSAGSSTSAPTAATPAPTNAAVVTPAPTNTAVVTPAPTQGQSSGSIRTYCPKASDLTVAYGTAQLYDQGWSVTGGGGAATKAAFNLLGGSVEFDIDFTNTRPGVNANIYTFSPAFIPSTGYSGNYYCDGAQTGSKWCVEVDWIESNGNCGAATTLHVYEGPGVGCTAWGCANSYTYNGRSSFHMKIEYGLDGSWTTTRDGVVIGPSNLSPLPTSAEWNILANAYKAAGAVIYSSQWVGWVPLTSQCGSSGSASDLTASTFTVKNLKITGSVMQGPTPNVCSLLGGTGSSSTNAPTKSPTSQTTAAPTTSTPTSAAPTSPITPAPTTPAPTNQITPSPTNPVQVTSAPTNSASTGVLFNGDFGYYASDTAMDSWSWANQVGIYQSYIFGSGYKISTYVDLSSSYCNSGFNPNCQKGALFMIDGTSRWNGQTMLRTEVIPQPQPAATGRRIYRFSMKNIDLNSAYEHQLVFFESHFVEIKYGQPLSPANGDVSDMFQFWVQGQMYWAIPSMGAWHNFAFDVDYSAQTVQLWWSLEDKDLIKIGTVRPLSGVSFSDFHVGILRLTLNNQQDSSATHIQYSNVFIESSLSDLTPSGSTTPSPTAATPAPTQGQVTPAPTNAAVVTPAPTQPQTTPAPTNAAVVTPAPTTSSGSTCPNFRFSQCGGMGFTGSTCCQASDYCYYIGPYYSQCVAGPAPGGASTPTSAPTTAAPTSSSGATCPNGPWSQCGGSGFSGQPCCTSGYYCKFGNTYYSQCVPGTGLAAETTVQSHAPQTLNWAAIIGASVGFIGFAMIAAAILVHKTTKKNSNSFEMPILKETQQN